MSESTTTSADMDMETVLTRAVKKLFKWQLSGLTGTLIVASMLWMVVFFVFFLILVFVMCVEYHYDKKDRRDTENALPKDDEKMWAEKRSSRENSNTSMRKVAPIPMPPIPVIEEPKSVIISDMPDVEPEVGQESPTEAVTEESVIVDAPQDEEPVASPPPPAPEEPAAEEADEQEQAEEAEEENPEDTQDEQNEDSGEGDPPAAEEEPEAEPAAEEEPEAEPAAEEEPEAEPAAEEAEPETAAALEDEEKPEDTPSSPVVEEDSEDKSNDNAKESEETKPPDSTKEAKDKGED